MLAKRRDDFGRRIAARAPTEFVEAANAGRSPTVRQLFERIFRRKLDAETTRAIRRQLRRK